MKYIIDPEFMPSLPFICSLCCTNSGQLLSCHSSDEEMGEPGTQEDCVMDWGSDPRFPDLLPAI